MNVDQLSECPICSQQNAERPRTMVFFPCTAVHPLFQQDEAVRIVRGLIPVMAHAALFIRHAAPEEAGTVCRNSSRLSEWELTSIIDSIVAPLPP